MGSVENYLEKIAFDLVFAMGMSDDFPFPRARPDEFKLVSQPLKRLNLGSSDIAGARNMIIALSCALDFEISETIMDNYVNVAILEHFIEEQLDKNIALRKEYASLYHDLKLCGFNKTAADYELKTGHIHVDGIVSFLKDTQQREPPSEIVRVPNRYATENLWSSFNVELSAQIVSRALSRNIFPDSQSRSTPSAQPPDLGF